MAEHGIIVVEKTTGDMHMLDSPSIKPSSSFDISHHHTSSLPTSFPSSHKLQPQLVAPDSIPPPDKDADNISALSTNAHDQQHEDEEDPSWLFDPRVDELCRDFTLHAIPRAMNIHTSLRRRSVWLLVFIAGLCVFLWLATVQIRAYLAHNTTTNVALIDESYGAGLPFPSVTIWNQNTVRRSAVENTPNFEDICGEDVGLLGDVSGGVQRYPLDWNDTQILNAAHQLDDMLVGCTFQGRECSAADFYPSVTPFPNQRYGAAYTFNIFGELASYSGGPTGGLSLAINIGQDDYCPRTWGAGVAFELHHHVLLTNVEATQHINPSNRAVIRPGVWANVDLSAVEQNLLGPPYGPACVDLNKGQSYPPKTAALDCAINCAGFETYNSSQLIHFNRADFLAVTSADVKCVQDCFNLTLTTFCQSGSINNVVTTMELPSRASVRSILKRFPSLALNHTVEDIFNDTTLYNKVYSNMQDNFILVNFYFSKLILTQFNESIAITFGALISNIGGLLGLFLGASAISVLELIEILTLLSMIKYDKTRVAAASQRYRKDLDWSQQQHGIWASQSMTKPAAGALQRGKSGVDKYIRKERRSSSGQLLQPV
eukprot:jgi/Chlat1/4576/Chrsp290S04328